MNKKCRDLSTSSQDVERSRRISADDKTKCTSEVVSHISRCL